MRKTPVTLGVLSITFGALTALGSVFTFFLGPMFEKLFSFTRAIAPQSPLQTAQMEAAEAVLKAQNPYTQASAAVYVVMSVALIVIGIGLYKRRPWARRGAIGWAALALVELVGNGVFSFVWFQPHLREVQRAVYAAHGLAMPFGTSPAFTGGTVLFSLFIYAAFPTVLLALLGRPSAAADFVSAPAATSRAA